MKVDLRDCSRDLLCAMAAGLVRDIEAGRKDLQDRLKQVLMHIPTAPEYQIEHDRN